MKNLLLIACLCLTSAAYAKDNKQIFKDVSGELKLNMRLHEADIKPVELGSNHFDKKAAATKDLQAESSRHLFFSKTFLNGRELKQMLEEVRTQRFDSIVGTQNSTGAKISRQYFTYDEKGNPVKLINSLWNTTTKTWEETEVHEFVCDEDGYVTSQRAYSVSANSGQRYDYEYNGQKLGISMTLYSYSDGKWTPVQKGEYEYDDRGNIIQETISAYDKNAPSSWMPVVQNKATWYENNRQRSIEPYEWNGSKWIGNGEKKEYEWDINGNLTLLNNFIWEKETSTWFNYHRQEQDFKNSDPKLCTRQEKKYYNKALNNWAGVQEYDGYVYHNTKSILEYDEQRRLTYECAYEGHTTDGYTKGSDIVYDWSVTSDGGTQCVITSTLYPSDKEAFVNDITTKRYDTEGNEVYSFEKHIDATLTDLLNYMEEVTVYDDKQHIIEYKSYKFDRNDNNKKLAVQHQLYVYDVNDNVIEFTAQRGQNTGDNDWVNYTHFTYAYEQDSIRIEEKAYKWDGSKYVPNWGNEYLYDYGTPLSDIIMWPGGNVYHKVLETRSYMGADDDWDYQSFKYYYSELPTGITGRNIDKHITVYPTHVDDWLNVVANEDVKVNIYNIEGMLMLTTADKHIRVSNLPAGLYVVEINGYKTKIVKK